MKKSILLTKPVLSLLCMLLSTFILPLSTSASQATDGSVLNQNLIHAEYNEGNFEKVTAALEGFMARTHTYSLDDSVFIAKHLAVVYSANPETREKGKYYMYRLLNLLPSAKLIDMYVSDEIDRIFDKVREEYLSRQKYFGAESKQAAPKHAATKPSTTQAGSQGTEEKSHTGYYIVGGAALAAIGVTSYFLLTDSPKKTESIYEIP